MQAGDGLVKITGRKDDYTIFKIIV